MQDWLRRCDTFVSVRDINVHRIYHSGSPSKFGKGMGRVPSQGPFEYKFHLDWPDAPDNPVVIPTCHVFFSFSPTKIMAVFRFPVLGQGVVVGILEVLDVISAIAILDNSQQHR
jgi:hypothetical protein